jgi:hypothetical protein
MSDLPCTPRRYLWTAKLRPGRAWRRGARAGARAQAFLYNPGNFGTPTQLSWASLTGQNFTAQHNSPHIDFCGAHFWPDRWVRARCRAVAHARARLALTFSHTGAREARPRHPVPPPALHSSAAGPGWHREAPAEARFQTSCCVARVVRGCRRRQSRVTVGGSLAWGWPKPCQAWVRLDPVCQDTPYPTLDVPAPRQTPDLGWNAAFFAAWVDGHAADCAALGKPFILEEFGKNVTVPVTPASIAATRDPAFASVYAKLLASLTSGGGFQARRPARTACLTSEGC